MLKIYLYDEITKQYHGEMTKRPNKTYPFSTTQKPPALKENQIAFFDEINNIWKSVTDLRGKIFWDKTTKKMTTITKLGEVPENLTDQKPDMYDVWVEDKWVFDREFWMKQYVRPKRDSLLKNSDKYLVPDFPITKKNREKWKKYRKELREITKTIEKENEVWPKMPDMKNK